MGLSVGAVMGRCVSMPLMLPSVLLENLSMPGSYQFPSNIFLLPEQFFPFICRVS